MSGMAAIVVDGSHALESPQVLPSAGWHPRHEVPILTKVQRWSG